MTAGGLVNRFIKIFIIVPGDSPASKKLNMKTTLFGHRQHMIKRPGV